MAMTRAAQVRLVTRHIERGTDYTVFTAASVMRRLATGCNATMHALVEAAIRTAASAPAKSNPRVRAAWQLRQALLSCNYEPADAFPTAEPAHMYEWRRLSPALRSHSPMQRTGAWRSLNTLRRLPRKVCHLARSPPFDALLTRALCRLPRNGSLGRLSRAHRGGYARRLTVATGAASATSRTRAMYMEASTRRAR